jgi:DMSO/TMAO reductase YedYZ molybdopterin-dependent catalytic subunit
MVAYAMNDAPLPMLNGFPLRLVVPGWFATYWVKALDRINVLPEKFKGFWMDKAYRIPRGRRSQLNRRSSLRPRRSRSTSTRCARCSSRPTTA